MAETYATEIAGQSTSPVSMANGAVVGGRLRRYRATITMASQTTSDTIVLAVVPAGSAFAYGVIAQSASVGASATVAIGIAGATGKYRAAAVSTAVDAPVVFGITAGMGAAALTAAETVFITIAVASLAASGTLVVDLYFSAP